MNKLRVSLYSDFIARINLIMSNDKKNNFSSDRLSEYNRYFIKVILVVEYSQEYEN